MNQRSLFFNAISLRYYLKTLITDYFQLYWNSDLFSAWTHKERNFSLFFCYFWMLPAREWVSEWANEWGQCSARANWALRCKRMSERWEQMSERANGRRDCWLFWTIVQSTSVFRYLKRLVSLPLQNCARNFFVILKSKFEKKKWFFDSFLCSSCVPDVSHFWMNIAGNWKRVSFSCGHLIRSLAIVALFAPSPTSCCAQR